MHDLVVYGLGELGQLYGAAALRAGLRVTPITRAVHPDAVLAAVPRGTPVLVAVSEVALPEVLANLERARDQDLILLQNELFPSSYARLESAPTVLVPWLLKKRGLPLLVARTSPIHGQHASLVLQIHEAVGLPAQILGSESELARALAEKYAFILTINALGVLRDRTLGLWLQEDPLRVRAIAREAAVLGSALAETPIEVDDAVLAVLEGMRALGAVGARGRTAEERVRRALEHAAKRSVATPEIARVLEQS